MLAASALRSSIVPLALLLSAGSIGCATAAGQGQARGRDMHVSATLPGGASRAIVSGPATLLHVDVGRADDLSLYRVARTDGDPCATAKRTPAIELRRGASNRVNIDVAADEIVCVAAGRAASLTWHARRAVPAAPTMGRLLASNERD
jgi:hypothetical protein